MQHDEVKAAMLELFAHMTVQMKIITKQVPTHNGGDGDAEPTLQDWDVLEAGGELHLKLDLSEEEEDSS